MKLAALRIFSPGSSGRRRFGIVTACLLGVVGLAGFAQAVHADPVYTLTLTPTDKKAGEAYQQQQDDPCVLGDASCKNPDGWYHPLTNNGGNDSTIDKWSFGTDGKNAPNNLQQWMAPGYLNGQDKNTDVGPFYTFDQLTNVLTCGLISGCTPSAPTDKIGFFIGIDTNGSSTPQNLLLFDIWECPYDAPAAGSTKGPTDCLWLAGFVNPTTTPNLTDPDTGTGWTNYILSANGLSFSAGHIYAFHAKYDQNGGADSFFLINEATPACDPQQDPTGCGQIPLPGTLALLGIGLLGLAGIRRVDATRTARPTAL